MSAALASAAAAVLPALGIWPLVRRALAGEAPGPWRGLLGLGLALVLGTGCAALLAYAWLAAGGALGAGYRFLEAALSLAGALAALRGGRAPAPPPRPGRSPWLERAALVALAAGLAVFLVAFLREGAVNPHGEWDAWSIWNLKARFMVRGGTAWTALFSPELAFSHQEYPLLLPAAVARVWAWAGESVAGPQAVAAVFAAGAALILAGAAGLRAGPAAGACAALLLLATPQWVGWSAAQYADVPLAALVAAAAAALLGATGAGGGPRTGPLTLAGLALGLCAWAKDDGVAAAVLFGGWALVLHRRSAARALLLLAAGAALPVLARVHFQQVVAPAFAAVTFVKGQGLGTALAHVADAGRWARVLALAPREFPGLELGLPAAALVAAALLGARAGELPRSPVLAPAAALYLVYLAVWAGTTSPLEWHVESTASRVLLQPWPAVLLGLLALVPPPPRSPAPDAAERPASTARASP